MFPKKAISRVVVHTFNPSTQETEAGGSLSLSPPWPTEQVSGQPGLHSETLSQKQNKKPTNQTTKQTAKVVNLLHSRYYNCKTKNKSLLCLLSYRPGSSS